MTADGLSVESRMAALTVEVPAPEISIARITDPSEGGVQLDLTSYPDTQVEIQTSSNLKAWNRFSVETFATENLEVIDEEAGEVPRRFYRGRVIQAEAP